MSAGGSGTVIRTAGGRVLAIRGNDGEWKVKSLGGRPSKNPKTHSLKVRLTQDQYQKVSDSADAQGITKVQVIRDLIDEL